MAKIKTTNGLMKHLRDNNGIEIKGSLQKTKLRNLGYFHLYKGYRFYKKNTNRIPYVNFITITRTYEYDIELKSLFYRWTIFLETALKNVILQTTIEYINSDNIRDFYDLALESGSSLPASSSAKEKKNATTTKLEEIKFLQNKIAENYRRDNPIVQHHYNRDTELPIWGLFEILMFGDLGKLVTCLKQDLRRKISVEIGLDIKDDQNAKILENFIFLIKDLRNAIAHDNVIYDGRFIKNSKGKGIRSSSIKYLELKTNINNIGFTNIEDLLILVCYLLKILGVQKSQIQTLVNNYINITEKFISDIDDPNITHMQFRPDTLPKAYRILGFL